MNVGRGLFRAWILVSILWVIGAGFMAYTIESPDALHGQFQPTVVIKKEVPVEEINEVDFGKPFYGVGVSPSQLNLKTEFSSYRDSPDAHTQFYSVDFPDGSRLYIPARYNEADRNYIEKQFWDQRWGRWGYAAGVIAAWALLPCVLLFILGYSLLWVGRGFKHA
jgi:hypothetical protein